MDIRKLQRAIVDGLEDVKGQNIVVFNTEHLSALFERVVIASGTSNRQTKALAASVRDAVKGKGFGPTRTEGEENGEWIIVDCGAAVVHLMQPGIRDYYHLEEIWGDKPVRLKLDNVSPRLVKASEPEPAARTVTGAKKASAKAAPARKRSTAPANPPTGSAAAKSPGAPAARGPAASAAPVRKSAARGAVGKAPAKQAIARKAAPARKAVVRSVGVKSGSARAASAKAPAARRAPAAKAPPATKASRRKA
jgi:ribosome-associated protein